MAMATVTTDSGYRRRKDNNSARALISAIGRLLEPLHSVSFLAACARARGLPLLVLPVLAPPPACPRHNTMNALQPWTQLDIVGPALRRLHVHAVVTLSGLDTESRRTRTASALRNVTAFVAIPPDMIVDWIGTSAARAEVVRTITAAAVVWMDAAFAQDNVRADVRS